MSTVSDLIHSSFRLIGAIAAGEILETNELNDAFISLNQMIAGWNTEGAALVGRQPIEVSVYGQNAYTLPLRPVQIVAASVWQNNQDSPLELVDAVGWDSITEKEQTSIFCKKLYCDYLYPTSTVFIWPIPRFSGKLEMLCLTPIPQFTDVNQTIDLAPGYELALRTNFAVLIEPEYPRSQMDPALPALAQNSKAALVQLNTMNHMRSRAQSPTQALIDQSSSATGQ